MKRFGDWAQYAGIAVLAAAVLLPFALPTQAHLRWWLVAAGVLLVVAGMLVASGVLKYQDRNKVADFGKLEIEAKQDVKITTKAKVVIDATQDITASTKAKMALKAVGGISIDSGPGDVEIKGKFIKLN